MRLLTYVLAVLAACANAVSSVLQRKANKRVPKQENMSLRQIGELLHQPVWFLSGSLAGGTAAARAARTADRSSARRRRPCSRSPPGRPSG
jgi:hypothetical protein